MENAFPHGDVSRQTGDVILGAGELREVGEAPLMGMDGAPLSHGSGAEKYTPDTVQVREP
ncbi:hypothetical protein [Phaeobacter sp. 11ANDIMAR09]|uniref:hypothetical protein n=1 Tax=Phaeobacter sp. 11ANDIMAR09 TaxID=1225647 RepID=UPI000B116F45|nr:hypothetical protein [Phaeobacter sp. 11ANDIMAR09]